MKKKIIVLLVLALILQNLHGLEIQSTGEELGFYFTPEFNRSLNFCWALSTVGAVTFQEMYTAKGGLALGGSGDVFDMKLFAGADVALPIGIPLFVGLSYNYYGLPKYEAHTHSLLPLVSLNYPRAGVSLGHTFRFTRFFGESPVFEPVFSFSAYVNFINKEKLLLGLKGANFSEFNYGNFGSYFFNLYSAVSLSEKLSLINEIELHQGGSVALSANFYGVVFRGGVLFSW